MLTVIAAHASVPFLPGGFVGVDVFFVISGFLISQLLFREVERSGRVSLAGFYARRARRILPAATVVTIATVAASALWLSAIDLKVVAEDALWAVFFLANVHFAAVGTDYFAAEEPPSPLQHYWSLSVEEQFYLVWPALLLLLVRAGPSAAAREPAAPAGPGRARGADPGARSRGRSCPRRRPRSRRTSRRRRGPGSSGSAPSPRWSRRPSRPS